MTTDNRKRTITWQDPSENLNKIPQMSGLQFCQAIVAGEIPQPPIAQTLDFYLTAVSDGEAIFTGNPAEFHYNPIGTVHGGFAATLLDSAMSCAVQTKVPQGMAYTTLEMKVNFVRPITAVTGKVTCVGSVVHYGRRTATAEGKLLDENSKLLAHGTTSCLIFPVEH